VFDFAESAGGWCMRDFLKQRSGSQVWLERQAHHGRLQLLEAWFEIELEVDGGRVHGTRAAQGP